MKIKICLLLLGAAMTLVLSAIASETTNSVTITTNLIFCLAKLKADGAQSQFKSDEMIRYMISGTSTNYVGYRHFPFSNFDFHMFDENGKEVPKTKFGIALTGLPPKPTEADIIYWRTSHFSPCNVDNKTANQMSLFSPNDVFMITNKGIYEMEIQIRLCVIMTNNMPDLNAMTDWRNVSSSGYPFVKDFGVLTSLPLRVKVIKE